MDLFVKRHVLRERCRGNSYHYEKHVRVVSHALQTASSQYRGSPDIIIIITIIIIMIMMMIIIIIIIMILLLLLLVIIDFVIDTRK